MSSNFAVVAVSGKQYLVKEGDEITVNKISGALETEINLPVLTTFDDEGKELNLKPKTDLKAKIIGQGKGEKIRVFRFKSKVRYRKTKGFRPELTKLRIISLT